MIIRGLAPALPHLRPALRLTGPALRVGAETVSRPLTWCLMLDEGPRQPLGRGVPSRPGRVRGAKPRARQALPGQLAAAPWGSPGILHRSAARCRAQGIITGAQAWSRGLRSGLTHARLVARSWLGSPSAGSFSGLIRGLTDGDEPRVIDGAPAAKRGRTTLTRGERRPR